jgi:putative transposase
MAMQLSVGLSEDRADDLADEFLLRITHPAYLALAHTLIERIAAYRAWLQAGIGEDDLKAIRSHLEQERALGSERFQKMVEKTLNLPATCRPRGRPTAQAS